MAQMNAYLRLVASLYYGPAPPWALEGFIAESKAKNEAWEAQRRLRAPDLKSAGGEETIRSFKK